MTRTEESQNVNIQVGTTLTWLLVEGLATDRPLQLLS